jgi:hypothetical protein
MVLRNESRSIKSVVWLLAVLNCRLLPRGTVQNLRFHGSIVLLAVSLNFSDNL